MQRHSPVKIKPLRGRAQPSRRYTPRGYSKVAEAPDLILQLRDYHGAGAGWIIQTAI